MTLKKQLGSEEIAFFALGYLKKCQDTFFFIQDQYELSLNK